MSVDSAPGHRQGRHFQFLPSGRRPVQSLASRAGPKLLQMPIVSSRMSCVADGIAADCQLERGRSLRVSPSWQTVTGPSRKTKMATTPLTLGKELIAAQTAKMLIEVKAILFDADKPFTFTSGWASPVYVDMRKIISYPRLRNAILDFAVTTVQHEIGYETIDVVAGGETAGIPYAAWLADRLMLPMQYIRKKPKALVATPRSRV